MSGRSDFLPIYIVVKCLLTVAKISHIVYHFALAGNNICLDTPFYEYCVILHLEIIDAAILIDVCILVSARIMLQVRVFKVIYG